MGKRKDEREIFNSMKEERWITRMYFIGNLSPKTISKITDYSEEEINKILQKAFSSRSPIVPSKHIFMMYSKIPANLKHILIVLLKSYTKKEKGNKEIFSKLTLSQVYEIIKPHFIEHGIDISQKDFYELYKYILIREACDETDK